MKAHVLVNRKGQLVELKLTPASISDVHALDFMDMYLPKGSVLYGDKAYSSYKREERLLREQGIRVLAQRKKNVKRKHFPEEKEHIRKYSKRV